IELGQVVVIDQRDLLGGLADHAFPLVQVDDLLVFLPVLRVVLREPGMRPRRRVVVVIDAWVVGGEFLHLVEAMLDRVGLGLVAEMPLAREVGRVAVLLEELGDRRGFLAQEVLITRRDDDRQRRADGNAPGDERGAASGATRLAIPTGEIRAFLGDAIDVWGRMAEVCASARDITEVTPADVVRHEDDDVWFLVRRRNRSDYAEKRSRGYKQ